MEYEEEYCDERQLSLYQDFPNIDESALGCLTPWPNGEEYCGQLFSDLYSAAIPDPLVPSGLSTDPFLRSVADVRSTLAHIALLRFNGAYDAGEGFAYQTFCRSLVKFSRIYPKFAATMIQRFWRAKRKNATRKDKVAFGTAMIVRPRNGKTPDERMIRAQLILELLTACPPQF